MPLPILKLAVQVAVTAASMAMTAMRKIEGPRLDSLKFTGGDYGSPLQLTWGKRRFECPIFWAEDLKEVKQERKTKGGKYNDYTYFGTWAVALAGHEITGITRVWFDTHLVYDVTGAGPVTPFDLGSFAPTKSGRAVEGVFGLFGQAIGGHGFNDHMVAYYGTETQEPDPRIMATVEAEFGEGSCPAYRGTAYIVFKDMPLEKVGNRIPQVSVEVVSAASDSFPYEAKETLTTPPYRMWGATFSNDYSRFLWSDGTVYEIWDVAARARMISGTWPVATTLTSRYGLMLDGSIYAVDGADRTDLLLFSSDGTSVATVADAFPAVAFANRFQEEIRVLQDGNGVEHWMSIPYSTVRYFYVDEISDGLSAGATADQTMNDLTGIDWSPTEWFSDGEGGIWAVGRIPSVGQTTAYFYRMIGGGDGPGFFSVAGLASSAALGECSAAYHDGYYFLCWGNAEIHKIDPADGSIVASRTGLSMDQYNTAKQWANLTPGASSIWLNSGTASAYEISLVDLTTIRTLDLTDWNADSADGQIYDPINHALITAHAGEDEITWRYLDRISGSGVTLGSIAADVADMVGVTDYSFTALDQVVQGWSATQGQASNMLEPLLDAYDSDIRPHDFTLQGVKRSGTSGGTILTERFVANDPRYSVKVRQAAELPRAMTVTFADVDADQQPNTARADRPLDATGAKGEQSIDMGTWATDADEARQLTDRFHRRIWNERKEVSNSLTAQHLSLEPGDLRTLDLDGESDIYRLVRLTVKASGELATEWKYDHPSLATLDGTTGAAFDGRNPSEIIVPLISKGFVLDIPLIQDVDDQSTPAVYILASPYASGTWPGAVVYQSLDGEYSDEIGSVASSAPATWGYATELPYANPNVWDRGSSITVTLQNGTLTGTTEAAIDANPLTNLAAIGAEGRWEIVQFTTATLGDPNTYTVSGFKRGRRGTEWAAELHTATDQFVLLDTAQDEALGLSEVGTNLSFKAVTSGRTAAGTFPIGLTPFTGASLKPYAPCHLEAVKESNDDWTLTWVRRTRVGGAWTSGTSIPLSEASEEYEVDILDAPGGSVVRTISGLSSATATYTAAQQVTDGGDVAIGDLYYEVYQISDAVDRGFAAEAAA